jgi:uncharacterized protein (TIGR03435 family)
MRILLCALVLVLPQAAQFEIASVKPQDPQRATGFFDGSASRITPQGDVSFQRISLRWLIAQAYGIEFFLVPTTQRLLEDPRWASVLGRLFDIEGKGGQGTVEEKLQALLRERFGLRVHWDIRQVPVYAVTRKHPGTLGPGLKPSHENCWENRRASTSAVCRLPREQRYGAELWHSAGTIHDLLLSVGGVMLKEPIVDHTGLVGNWEWEVAFSRRNVPDLPTLFSAFEDQLGLKLTKTVGPWEMLVIDDVHEPTPN